MRLWALGYTDAELLRRNAGMLKIFRSGLVSTLLNDLNLTLERLSVFQLYRR